MEKSKKILSLFNQRIKQLYLNGYTKFQLLNELRIFYQIEDEKDKTLVNRDNNIFLRNDTNLINRKINKHFSKELFFNESFDEKFVEINKYTKKISISDCDEFKLVDEFLDNSRIKDIKDISLSSSITIFDKPFDGRYISKNSYLELINGIYNDCDNNKETNLNDNLLLFENAFKYIKYSIEKVKDRIEIYKELVILLSKLAIVNNLDNDMILKYFNIYSLDFISDLIIVNDSKYIMKVMKSIYNNIQFNMFIIIVPIFVESFSSCIIDDIIKKFNNDVFIKKNDNYNAIINILIFNSNNKKIFYENINSNNSINEFEKDLSLLEFAINYEDIDSVKYYFDKIKLDEEYYLYENLLEDLITIVNSFDRIINLEKKIENINEHNFKELLIEVEQLNYLNRKVYSCAMNRLCSKFLDKKNFNFYFLLLLVNLGLDDKVNIYFFNNIKYVQYKNKQQIFKEANILFLLNYFEFSIELLVNLATYLQNNNSKKDTSLFLYITLELNLIKELVISNSSNKKIEEILKKIK